MKKNRPTIYRQVEAVDEKQIKLRSEDGNVLNNAKLHQRQHHNTRQHGQDSAARSHLVTLEIIEQRRWPG